MKQEIDLRRFPAGRKRVCDVTAYDAEQFRRWMDVDRKLSPNIINRQTGVCRQFFNAAIRRRLIADNPFAGLPIAVRGNPNNNHFVTTEEAYAILEACPDAEWRAIVALCRWGGLRCPSEVLALRWSDVLWDRDRFRATSPKTSRYGKGERWVPLFPQLRAVLAEAWDITRPGEEFVITRYRSSVVNLRTQLHKITRRAGLTPWPKSFVSMRSTRATELARSTPAHLAAAWLGHSEAIAREHYLQVTDADFNLATQLGGVDRATTGDGGS